MSTATQILTSTEEYKLTNDLHALTVEHIHDPRHYRNLCMVLLMLDGGLRVGEVVKLLVSDLIIEFHPVLNLCITADIAKNNRRRIVPFTHRLTIAVGYMITKVWSDSHMAASPYAFTHRHCAGHLSTRQVERIVKRAAIAAIDRPIHPHVLRHTFATKLLSRTNIRVVQKLLGHTQLSSTMIYTHPNDQDLREAIDKLGTNE